MLRHSQHLRRIVFTQGFPSSLSQIKANNNLQSDIWLRSSLHATTNLKWLPSPHLHLLKPEFSNQNVASSFVQIEEIVDYFNLDQLVHLTDDFALMVQKILQSEEHANKPQNEFSMFSQRPFSPQLGVQLKAHKVKRKFRSNIWIVSTGCLAALQMTNKTPPCSVLVRKPLAQSELLINSEYFQHADEIKKLPISAYTCLPFKDKNVSSELRRAVYDFNFSTGLFFTAEELQIFNLQDKLKPRCSPVFVDTPIIDGEHNFQVRLRKAICPFQLFNLSSIHSGVSAYKSAKYNQFPPTSQHTLFATDEVITDAYMKRKLDLHPSNVKYTSWLTWHDIVKKESNMKLNASFSLDDGVFWPGGEEAATMIQKELEKQFNKKIVKIAYYNCDLLEDPNLGFSLAGRTPRK